MWCFHDVEIPVGETVEAIAVIVGSRLVVVDPDC